MVTDTVLQVPLLLMELLHGPLTEAARMQGLGSGSRPGQRHDSASRQGLGPGPGLGLGSGHWLNYAVPLHRMREFGLIGVHVGTLDCMMIDQDLAPATMHRCFEYCYSTILTGMSTLLTTCPYPCHCLFSCSCFVRFLDPPT